jgi:hypothetical protein
MVQEHQRVLEVMLCPSVVVELVEIIDQQVGMVVVLV